MFKNIVVGLSGGVDSAVATLLLKQKGFNVTATFLRNWDTADETGKCLADEDYKDAKYVATKLDVPLVEVNFVKEYWNDVFTYLVNSYENGETPNPDIMCNRNIKFNKFYNYARNVLKADAIATGHYARTSFGPFLEDYIPNTKVKLFQGIDHRKDQSFFLSQVVQEPLQRCMFPLAPYRKWEVKKIANAAGLERIARKDESMGICFIGSRCFRHFISEYIEDKPGNFIDYETGKTLGQHRGFHNFTIGQRCRIQGLNKRHYVFRKIVETNEIIAVSDTKHPALYSNIIVTSSPHWICEEPPELQNHSILECEFKFQHVDYELPCKVFKNRSGQLVILINRPLRALTPGQFGVLYLNGECLGSAPITTVGPSIYSLGKTLADYEINRNNDQNNNDAVDDESSHPGHDVAVQNG